MTVESAPSRKAIVQSILGVNLFLIGFCVVMWWLYHSYSTYLLEFIEHQRPLLVFQSYQTALLFVWPSLLSGLVAINIEMVFVKLLRQQMPRFLAVVQKLAVYGMFLGIGLVLFGGQLVNPQWAKTFSEAGYSPCETNVLRTDRQFFNEAWVLEAEDCYDPVLKQILHDDHRSQGVEKGARYLEKKHGFLREHNAGMPSTT